MKLEVDLCTIKFSSLGCTVFLCLVIQLNFCEKQTPVDNCLPRSNLMTYWQSQSILFSVPGALSNAPEADHISDASLASIEKNLD